MADIIEFGDEKPKKRRSQPKKQAPKPPSDLELVPLEDQIASREEVEVAENLKDKNRTLAAVNMRTAGFSYQAIAEKLDFNTPRMARQTVIAAIAAAGTIEDAKSLREIESARLDRLLASIWTKAIDPNNPDQLQNNRRASEIIEQHTRLHGLNAPSVLAVINPDAEKFQQVLGELKKATEGQVDHEADIFDFELDDQGFYGQKEEPGDEGGA